MPNKVECWVDLHMKCFIFAFLLLRENTKKAAEKRSSVLRYVQPLQRRYNWKKLLWWQQSLFLYTFRGKWVLRKQQATILRLEKLGSCMQPQHISQNTLHPCKPASFYSGSVVIKWRRMLNVAEMTILPFPIPGERIFLALKFNMCSS